MLSEHHAAALTEITETLVPAAERALPLLRRQLAGELDRFHDSISGLIRADVPRALALCGLTLDPAAAEALDPVVEEVRARHAGELFGLARQLEGSGPLSIRAFVETLVAALEPAMHVQGALAEQRARPFEASGRPELDGVAAGIALHPEDLRALIEGDSAFRTLHYFLEVLKPVLQKVEPRSMVALRSGKT